MPVLNFIQANTNQSMVFSQFDDGPCYMSKIEKETCKLDRLSGKRRKIDLTKSEIVNALKSHDDNLKFELDQIRTNLGKKGIISKLAIKHFGFDASM